VSDLLDSADLAGVDLVGAAARRRTSADDIINALVRNNGNVSEAARELGLSRQGLYLRFKRYPALRELAAERLAQLEEPRE
jgi:transcriptional regulator of acetoin/glycerol metabolism